MKTSVLSLLALSSLWLAGCAIAPKTVSPWQAEPKAAGQTRVVYRTGAQALSLRSESAYSGYRLLSRSEYLRHRVPVEAASAYVGRQGRYNYDVFYLVEEDRGQAIYGFTFGKFDIEWPPYLLYRVDRSGKVTPGKRLP